MVKNLLEDFNRRHDLHDHFCCFVPVKKQEKAGKPIVVDHALVENAI